MERLTKVNDHEALSNEPLFSQMVSRLREYEDAEESGLLLRLPCKIGTILYDSEGFTNGEPDEYHVTGFQVDEGGLMIEVTGGTVNPEDIGKIFFYTADEANKAAQ